ncbi:GW domain-containing glycosaminoglycan-binding protein [Enterococcus sp. LJL98]
MRKCKIFFIPLISLCFFYSSATVVFSSEETKTSDYESDTMTTTSVSEESSEFFDSSLIKDSNSKVDSGYFEEISSQSTEEFIHSSEEELTSSSSDEIEKIAPMTLYEDYGESVTTYQLRIVKNNWDLWNQPYVVGAKSLGKTTEFYNQTVTISREGKKGDNIYALISLSKNGTELGWINKNGLDSIDPFYSREGELIPNTYRYITKNNWDVWSGPFQTGVKSVANTKSYLNEKVLITRRARTNSGTYAKIWIYKNNRYNYLGWFNESGLSDKILPINEMSGELIPNTYGRIVKKNWTIWEKPYKPGTNSVSNTTKYQNETLLFTRKSKTNYGLYYKMWARKNGRYQFVGWVKQEGTTLGDNVEYNKSVSIPMKRLSKKNWTIWDRPYLYGAKSVGNTSNYYNQNLQIISEAKTNYGVYYQVKSYGKTLGWINNGGFSDLHNEHVVPLVWANQINTAGYAPSGCAACAAYTVLHSKNIAMDKNLTWFYNNLPLHHSNPDIGQIGSPWNYNDFKAVISPVGLSKFMNSIGGNTENITGQSLEFVKTELKKGNPVMFWGRVGLSDVSNSNTTHVMIFMGYKDGAFLVQDPAYGNLSMGRRWFSENRVENYLNIKGRKMVLVK